MAKLYNLARMTTGTTGTGTMTLGSPITGFLSFASAGVSNGETVAYGIRDGNDSEVGTGVYTSSGTTLTRSVITSTNSNNAISLTGAAEVYITAFKEQIGNLTENNSWTGIQTVTRAPASNTSTDGVILTDTTAASSGNQQWSPRLRLTGQAWKTDTTAESQPVDWIIENQTIQSAADGDGSLIFSFQSNGGGYVEKFRLDRNANLSAGMFVSGSITGIALRFDGTTAIRDSGSGAHQLSFDISTGGATHGSFIWQSSNAFTALATLDSTTFSLPKTITVAGGTIASNTAADGAILTDATAATSGNQQYSPRLRLTGQGWKTNATAASQTVDWTILNEPVQGATNPGSQIRFDHQVNGGGYNNRMLLYSNNDGQQVTLTLEETGSSQLILNVSSANTGAFYADAASVIIGATANIPFKLYSNNTLRAYIPAASGFVVGNGASALATSATDGFLYIPTCAGTPTGTVTAQTGTVAMVYDTSGNKLYIYNSGWKGGTVPGTWS